MLLYSLFIWCSWMSTTCLHSHISIYSNLILFNNSQNIYVTLNNSFSNIIIPSQRLVTMSASLHTQTVLHCPIIQVLNTRVWFLNISITCFTSVPSKLEHGLVILTESFSLFRSVLHNLSCWSPKQKSTSIDTQYNFLTSVALHGII